MKSFCYFLLPILLIVGCHASSFAEVFSTPINPGLRVVKSLRIDSTNHMGFASFTSFGYANCRASLIWPLLIGIWFFLTISFRNINGFQKVFKFDLNTREIVSTFSVANPFSNCQTTPTYLVCFSANAAQLRRCMFVAFSISGDIIS